jgi:hypothetical protein
MARPNLSLTVACPRCGAQPGDNCVTLTSGRITTTHPERTRAVPR